MAQNTNFKVNKYNNQKRKLPYIKARIDKLVDVDDCKRYCQRCGGNSRNQSDELKKRLICCNACK